MAILAGIDEAGYGPLLGPLIVSSTAFRVPDEMLKEDMWKVLKNSVANDKKKLGGKILITDSKKAYSRSTGIIHLKRAVLAGISILGGQVSSLYDLVHFLAPDSLERHKIYPWYNELKNYQIKYDKEDLQLATSVLIRDMKANNIEFVGIESCCIDVSYYNQMVDIVKNKASVLFSSVCKLINNIIMKFPQQTIQILVDRQGGRTNYRQALMDMFEQFEMKVIKEEEKISSYELTDGKTTVKIHFAVSADDRFLPVALGSMTSKYLREELVEVMNLYFVGKCPPLKPTAGYWKDGTRFVEDLKKYLPDELENRSILIRSR